MMPWWMGCVLVGILLMLATLGASLAAHLLAPHSSHALRHLRLAGLALVVIGEVVLLQEVVYVLTGIYSVVVDFLFGRVFGLACPLLLVQASVGYHRTALRNSGYVGGPEEGQSGTLPAERICNGPSSPPSMRNGKLRRHSSFLLSFLPSYLWTVALVASCTFVLCPGVYPCWFGLQADSRTRFAAQSLSGHQNARSQMVAGATTDYSFNHQARSQTRDSPPRASETKDVAPGIWTEKGGLAQHLRPNLDGDLRAVTVVTEKTSDLITEPSILKTSGQVHLIGTCVYSVGAEVLLYIMFFLPLALYWVLASSIREPDQISPTHVNDAPQFLPYAGYKPGSETTTHLSTSGSFPAMRSEPELEKMQLHPCTEVPSFSGMTAGSPRQDKVPSEKCTMKLETSTSAQAASQTKAAPTQTAGQELHFAAESASECNMCQALAPSVVLACAVLVIQSLLCPLLWAASTWFSSRQLRVVPTEVMFLPAFSALCLAYRSLSREEL